MIIVSDTQFDGQTAHRHDALIERVSEWLLNEDSAWPLLDPSRRTEMLGQIIAEAELAGMVSERDFAVFCRATILLRMAWTDFIAEPQNQEMLRDPSVEPDSKLRAWFHRCWTAAQRRARQKAQA